MLSQKLLISSFVYILYFWYLNRMFENDRSYQYLTEIEREMSLTSEQSLYYYYYKVLINDDANNNNNNDDFVPKNFTELLVEKIFNDDRSQAPNIVNAFKVLTILPEILLAISYRTMRTILIQYFRVDFDQDWRRCYLVENIIDENDHDQNNNQPNSIISTCEGIGEPFYFYIYSIFAINGFVPILIGWIAYYIGNHSICSMIMAIIMFTLNQTQSSRVQWAVPLRENFGYPLFLFHQLYLIKYFIELLPNIINYHHNHHSDNNEKFIQKYFLINIAATILQSLLQLGNVFVLRSPYFYSFLHIYHHHYCCQ
ncbi:dpy-19-like protein 1-like protein [Dermatophagoides farinae]|uniref:Dpy-19-like protein 1-like protein n=1 Tax=Dermatophagoides farinae TaxID=6954 RepID=A0A9D4SIH3_DERFA|nr:dpy-19-like protein 1-like protein [Dermatophagoides farinae]